MKKAKKLKGYTFNWDEATFTLRQSDFSFVMNETTRYIHDYILWISVQVLKDGYHEAHIEFNVTMNALGGDWNVMFYGTPTYGPSMLRATAELLDELNRRWKVVETHYRGFNSLGVDYVVDAILDHRFIPRLHDLRSEIAPIANRDTWRANEDKVRSIRIQEQLNHFNKYNSKTEAA